MELFSEQLVNQIFNIDSEKQFERLALNIFKHQAKNCTLYGNFINLLGVSVESVEKYTQIPYLPIDFFKQEVVLTGTEEHAIVFTSSRTTGSVPSRHFIKEKSVYERSLLLGFQQFFGDPREYVILGLLPSYMENPDSSLIYMVNYLMEASGNKECGFFRNDYRNLHHVIDTLRKEKKRIMLWGVSHALLDLTDNHAIDLSGDIVIETGGMKGRKEEMTREELHKRLQSKFNLKKIYSEYGMTELLSQAYSFGGCYQCPPWMKVLIRSTNDPYDINTINKTGGINIIDLANIHSCCFIATDDLGKLCPDGTFEVQGRIDYSDIRGCNLLV